jgi:uncharacterized membrane protein YfcA
MGPIDIIIYISIGLAAATSGALMGVGGGYLMVPIFIFMGFTEDYAPVLSLFVIIFVAVSASLKYGNKKLINYRLVLLYAPFSILGTILGVQLLHIVSNFIFKIVFSGLIIFIGIRLILKKNENDNGFSNSIIQNNVLRQRKSYYWIILWGFLTGVAASFIGIGGGLIAVPVLSLFFLETIHVAIATSLFIMIFTASFATLQNFFLGYLDGNLALIGLIIAIGAIIGSQIGSYVQVHLKGRSLKLIFGCFMIGIAIPLLWLRPLI